MYTKHPDGHQAHHQAHPASAQQWQTGICDCSPCSSCLLAWCLPCMLFGRTSTRLRDPSMVTHEEINGDCALWCGINSFTGCGWIFTMLKRGEIRERYGIEGTGTKDCCVSYWCPCCALIQQDNEVKARAAAAAPITQGYQQQTDGMHVPQQMSPAPQQQQAYQQQQPPYQQQGLQQTQPGYQ